MIYRRWILIVALLATSQVVKSEEFLVKVRSHYAINSFEGQVDFRIADYHPEGQLMKIVVPRDRKVSALVKVLTNPQVEYVVPNFKLQAFSVGLETVNTRQQYALDIVRAREAWTRIGARGSRKVVVAVIDTGVDYRHGDLSPNMLPGYDFARNDGDPMDETSWQNPGHGTHCAGIVGAAGIQTNGVLGMSPEVSIIPIRFLDQNGSGDLNNSIKAIDFAIAQKADVISASWGGAVPRAQARPLIEAIERAEKAGIVFVAAAGNDGRSNDRIEVFPANANLSNTISVAASNARDNKPQWSNFGRGMVHVAAPGDNIVSTLPNNRYGSLSGTSMAAPLVSGLVALIRSLTDELTPAQIRSLLQATGSRVNIETACDCRVDALNAVETVLNRRMFVHPQAATLSRGQKLNFEAVYGVPPFTFESTNPQVASINQQGELTALQDGETTVRITDSRGQVATSYKIYVSQANRQPDNGNPDQPDIPGGECPFGDPLTCAIICQIIPNAPWCQ